MWKKTVRWVIVCALALTAVLAAVFWKGADSASAELATGYGQFLCKEWNMQESILLNDFHNLSEHSPFSGVPYFRDDTGKLLQEENGYIYGYWGGVLARYDADTLERDVLFEAASEQDGRLFCMDGEYIYFLEVPVISPYGKKSILYRVKKDGTELTVLDENVPDAGTYYEDDYEPTYYKEYEAMDIEKDILYLIHDDMAVCYRIKPDGGVELIDMEDSLYGMIPEGFHVLDTSSDHIPYRRFPSLPYCAENYGYFFVCNEEHDGLFRVDVESGAIENMTAGLPEKISYDDRLLLTHDSLFFKDDNNLWLRRGLEKESEWETWYESDTGLIFCNYDENGMYVESWMEGETEDRQGVWSLYRISWEGERTCLFSMEGEHYFSEHPKRFYGNRFYVFGDYMYYCAASEQDEGIYRLPIAEAEKNADTAQSQLVCLYYQDKSKEISYIESVKAGPEGDVIVLPTQFDKLYLYEQTSADRKINLFLDKLYRECEAELMEDNEAFCRDFETDWERGWFSDEYSDMEEQEQRRLIAEQSTEEISISISYLSEVYLVVDLSGYFYWYPGAHGTYWDKFYVFDRRTGERLTILDFVDNTEEEVEEIVSTYLELCGFSPGAEGVAQETERFYLTAEGIGIHYDVYELAAYVYGAQDIIIPYTEFRIKEE
ncbi:MAG: DUF3298 domain-containing protein [Lachnospiraceae bacterium]|nr:DUF3298 domain-containing protein [Lachnospiraceae bacterium]